MIPGHHAPSSLRLSDGGRNPLNRSLVFALLASAAIALSCPAQLRAEEEPTPHRTGELSLLNPAVLAIRTWQLFSHHAPFHIMNCQFRPSCSEYGLDAIREAGTPRGVLCAADRVIRCNPWAGRHYDRDADGRLRDPFTPGPHFRSHTAPQVCIPLSLVVPGLNKMANGRLADGLTTLLVTDLTGYSAYRASRSGSWLAIPCAIAFSLFYASDVYFNCISLGER